MKKFYVYIKTKITSFILIAGCIFLSLSVYSQQSALDVSFGVNGTFQSATYTDFNINKTHDMALQSDGKILIVGETFNNIANFNPPTKIVVMRLDTNGNHDPSFGLNGLITPNIGGQTEKGYSIAVQADGKIVVAGTDENEFLLVTRYTVDGSLDSSFNGNGVVTTLLTSSESDMAIQSDGKIVIVFTHLDSISTDFMIVRLTSAGAPDSTFDNDGVVITGIANYFESAEAIAIQNDGKIIVSGTTNFNNQNTQFTLLRYNTDGALDNTFDSDGVVYTQFDSLCSAYSVGIQSDGKIVVSGSTSESIYNQNLAISRYNTDGTLDNSFDGDGKLIVDAGYRFERGVSIALQSDQKLVVGGWVSESPVMDFALLRCNPDGSIDNTFDNDGIITTDLGTADRGAAIKIQTDGKILLAGTREGIPTQLFTVCRYKLFEQFAGVETLDENKLQIYPNPSSHIVNIGLDENMVNGNLSITNISGEVIFQKNNINGDHFSIDISTLSNGVYYLYLQSNKKSFQQILVKQ